MYPIVGLCAVESDEARYDISYQQAFRSSDKKYAWRSMPLFSNLIVTSIIVRMVGFVHQTADTGRRMDWVR